ncbi:MAG: hypothetical protein FWF97_01760 [Alphaproteobacteria bacterium]|nr:hypothetical protein [Alphaproteobacteria bacterium]
MKREIKALLKICVLSVRDAVILALIPLSVVIARNTEFQTSDKEKQILKELEIGNIRGAAGLYWAADKKTKIL